MVTQEKEKGRTNSRSSWLSTWKAPTYAIRRKGNPAELELRRADT